MLLPLEKCEVGQGEASDGGRCLFTFSGPVTARPDCFPEFISFPSSGPWD